MEPTTLEETNEVDWEVDLEAAAIIRDTYRNRLSQLLDGLIQILNLGEVEL